jgi:hypothetical protein
LWKIIERKVIPNDFPTIIRSSFVIKKKFCAMKANADLAIVMFVKDKFFKLVESLDDPTDQWIKLAQKSKIGDTSQLFMDYGKLHKLCMKERSSIEEYLIRHMSLQIRWQE